MGLVQLSKTERLFLVCLLNRNQARKDQLSRPGPSPRFNREKGGKILEEALFFFFFEGGQILVMSASSGAYS